MFETLNKSEKYMNNWINNPCHPLDTQAREAALKRQGQLTKPPGALGRLEQLAVQLAAQQGQEQPWIEAIQITVFAADHGIAREGVSAFPQAVTLEMVKNFSNGGAAVCVLAQAWGRTLRWLTWYGEQCRYAACPCYRHPYRSGYGELCQAGCNG